MATPAATPAVAAASRPRKTRTYHCIRCLQESSTLYRKFSPTSIKLTVCTQCRLDVDPYVEREAFLVVMDAVLLRQDAYRHLLLNRSSLLLLDEEGIGDNHESFDVMTHPRQAMQYVLATSVLQTYLMWEAYRDTSSSNNNNTNHQEESLRDLLDRYDAGTISILGQHLFPQAVARILTLWAITYVCLRALSAKPNATMLLLTRTYLAVLLPTAFAVVIILVLVWENTFTVRLLGSLLILTYQVLSIYTVASVQGLRPAFAALTILLAVILASLVSWTMSSMGGLSRVPCAGFLYEVNSSLSLCLS